MKRRAVNGDEQDAYSQWRHLLCYLQRPGVVKKIKRATHKRERQEGKREARSEY
jgi:hypothetical protein